MLGFDDKDAIWNSQTTYLNNLNYFARDVFGFIDPGLKPEIILIGIDNSVRYDFSLPYYNYPTKKPDPLADKPLFKIAQGKPEVGSQSLDQIFEIAKNLETDSNASEVNSFRSTKAKVTSLRFALLQILSTGNNFSEKMIFISGEKQGNISAEINGYTVFTVLFLEKSAFLTHGLPREFWSQNVKDPDMSFAHATATMVLRECVLALRDPHKGHFGEIIERSSEELLHRAARSFMQSIGRILSKSGGPNLFDSYNLISSLPYEGAEGVGSMVLVAKNSTSLKLALELERPFPLKDFRKVRKFLELSKQGLLVVCDGTHIVGLCRNTKKNESLAANLVIDFTGHFRWKVRLGKQLILSVAYSQPVIERSRIDDSKFRVDLPRIFSGILPQQVDHICALVHEGIGQKHGTMLVISDDAQSEAQRLASQALIVKPVRLTSSMMLPLSAIDGAILMDRHGVCHGIGVILDGPATKQGDSSRGARYNSAIKYFQDKRRGGLMIIIISEDGMVNLIPNLMPQVFHSVISARIEELKTLASDTIPDQKVYNRVMGDLDSYKFYLSRNECKIVNQKSREASKKIKDPLFIDLFKQEFRPYEEMNESYYLD
ncbi:hypothetical protein J2Y45_006033 [Dyadobacter sp. BE34]|uniref:DAC domain-containing protein n=1 Tax=Dyadobacter fermentans TaxID=94254 RepID=A0ABU1R5Y9_9BACT|nr:MULTISPECIES: hypothetical protein [Dyadobacter]MDR6808821.1 hypothetical protein [Dyadobacter fermentans]MDR7046564.1 hypothetical protein [Dyadobacter sp. BE242]MDR7200877.1 hypothetical protein [Dyadobacter sp. BE34]MDR7218838.1 hypothetical protein [Dyadobacter sp. BE31]MDR7266767.1 hypothetical protein [Dyadobacter sp. BE32]